MNDILVSLLNLLPAMWSRRWWGLAVAWGIVLVGAGGLTLYKERYEASATMYVDTQSTLQPLLSGLAVQPDVSEQVRMLARTLLSRANLEKVIDANRLLPPGATLHQRAVLLAKLGQSVKLQVSGHDNIYELSYIGHDPAKVLGVVSTLMSLFVKQGLAGNAQQSNQALQFIDEQIAAYNAKLLSAENQLRQFRSEHPGYSTPGANDLLARQAQLQDQLLNLQGQLAAAVSSRAALQGQLAEVPPTLAPELVPGTPASQLPTGSDLDQRIAVEQARLDNLLQRYTDAYPDVISTRRVLHRLEAERRLRRQRAAATPEQHHYSQGTNPVYQQLRISLAQASANVASLRSQISDVQTQLQKLHVREMAQPGLDEKYVQLTRDYNVLNQSYQQLVQRRETALLSRNQDQTQRKDYFRVVDPPRLAPAALFPRRNMLTAAVLFLAICGGIGTTALIAFLLPSFHNARQLRESTDRPVLGSVGLVATPARATAQRRDLRLFVTATLALLVTYVAWGLVSALHAIR